MKTLAPSRRKRIVYPESDGQPMGDSTLQIDWIFLLASGLTRQYRQAKDVAVAANLFWYPVRGKPRIVTAADVMVVFGRPQQERRSYLQWNEEDVAPHVTFEIKSHTNTKKQLQATFDFYEQYGVEEYYLLDPKKNKMKGWLRRDGRLRRIPQMFGWKSPRLGIRFESDSMGLHVFGSHGREFLNLKDSADREASLEEELQKERDRIETERLRLEAERTRIEAENERFQAELMREQAERMRINIKLREKGIDPDTL